jgi:hypothetical protein
MTTLPPEKVRRNASLSSRMRAAFAVWERALRPAGRHSKRVPGYGTEVLTPVYRGYHPALRGGGLRRISESRHLSKSCLMTGSHANGTDATRPHPRARPASLEHRLRTGRRQSLLADGRTRGVGGDCSGVSACLGFFGNDAAGPVHVADAGRPAQSARLDQVQEQGASQADTRTFGEDSQACRRPLTGKGNRSTSLVDVNGQVTVSFKRSRCSARQMRTPGFSRLRHILWFRSRVINQAAIPEICPRCAVKWPHQSFAETTGHKPCALGPGCETGGLSRIHVRPRVVGTWIVRPTQLGYARCTRPCHCSKRAKAG